MNENVPRIMIRFSDKGIVVESLVTKPSINPAATKNGMVLNMMYKLSLNPIRKELTREYVPGKRTDAANIKPEAVATIILKISIAP